MVNLSGKTVLVTGGAHRIGKSLVLAAARGGADVVLHFGTSRSQAEETRSEVESLGRKVHLLQADLADKNEASGLVTRAYEWGPVDALVNNAAIFEPLTWRGTTLEGWNRHLMVNLTAPFLLSQDFARRIGSEGEGRIINLLDWRALRPGPDHLPYTIAKAALAALTKSLAQAFAPNITVNGLALGAILPPSSGEDADGVLQNVPARRWAGLEELEEAFLFLLTGPAYITGEILNLDGGRQLV